MSDMLTPEERAAADAAVARLRAERDVAEAEARGRAAGDPHGIADQFSLSSPPPARRKKMRRKLPWVVGGSVVALLVVIGLVNGSQKPTAAAPTPAAIPSAVPVAPTLPAEEASAEVGQAVSNGGITLTVTGARVVESVEMNESNFRPGSGYETYTETRPQQGAKFVMIQTRIFNSGKSSVDLTCSWPVDAKLIDALDREFDPIDDLYKLKGNPECNYQLQPGFEAEMTYVHLVPEAATITAWSFRGTAELGSTGPATLVRVEV
ncbi:DUF4352 domain-containing protein [Pseudonocardia kunmingensis]|uniref:DUF4352 domain-containing protein n=1 Tax=Pseudonocardia kunmingensis TaxID=630975 RepID=A0A543DPC6_9PSEU|nr:DUF4352 domain-containing protein [Pseudonocardia kunmingensis]TQM11155.1 hypothetical protein FB558_3707 [Pseudonocardia kunmingensis]